MGIIIGIAAWIFIIIAFIFPDEPWIKPVGFILGAFVIICGLIDGGFGDRGRGKYVDY